MGAGLGGWVGWRFFGGCAGLGAEVEVGSRFFVLFFFRRGVTLS